MIARDIYVTERRRVEPISVVYGSDKVGIALNIKDFTIPAGSTAVAMAAGKQTGATFQNPCTIDGNAITFYPAVGFFAPGWNALQVRVSASGGTILSFQLDAICDADISEGQNPATPEAVRPLVARAEDAAKAAESSKTQAQSSAASAAASQKAAATSETNAASSASAAVSAANAAATSETNAAASASAAITAAKAAATSETNAAASAKLADDKRVGAWRSEQAAKTSETKAAASQTAAATSETNAAKSAAAAEKSAQGIRDSAEKIDRNAEDVSQLKKDLSNKITKFYASNQGETHLADSDNGKIMDMMLYGKSLQDGTPTHDNPVEIKSVVNPKVKVFNENGTEFQTITIPYTLNAIPVSSGGNVTIGEQQYISDYLDIEKGKLYRKVKRINVKDLNVINIVYGQHSNGNGFLSISTENVNNAEHPISNKYKGSAWTTESGCVYTPNTITIVLVDNRFTDKQTALKLAQDTYVIYVLSTPTEEDLALEQIKSLKSLSTYYPVTNITVGSEELDGYAVFNYPISMANGWNYVKKQLNDNRNYIYDMDFQSAEAYVNSEYAVALTELEV